MAPNVTKPPIAHNATKPPLAPKDPFFKEKKASQKMEIVLATLSMPAKEDLKGKGLESLTAAPAQSTKAPTEDKLVIKMK